MITKHVQQPWFSYIKSGEKTIEGRLNKGAFSELCKGDIIKWKNENQIIKTKIISIHHHQNFEKMLRTHKLKNVLPGIKTYRDGVKVYHTFFSHSDIKKYGVLAIKIKRL